ncbi:MAG: CotH kinase family protein [Bacteroidales bacterium]|nr:CotH kinase family protein [Bacteroidales bacterium]
MKRLLLFVLLVLSVSCGKDRISEDDAPDAFLSSAKKLFDDTRLPDLRISVSEDEWNRLLELYDKEPHNHDYVSCPTVSIDGGGLSCSSRNVGLRLRGQTSRRRPEGSYGQPHAHGKPHWRHVHFGLNCRTFSDTGSFAGIRRINLKYAKEDPTYIREHYCYDLLAGYGIWTAPLSSWCRLYLQIGADAPVYYGVYLMTESIDMQYVRRRPGFGSDKGWLWKCAWGANLRDRDDWRFHQDDNSPNTYPYELKDEDPESFGPAKAQFKDFLIKLNTLKGAEFHDWILKVCDVDLLLKMYAANVALGHWDDYWNDMNNFYLYFNSKDPVNYRVYMLPYDYDNTLGTSHKCGVQTDSGRHDPYNWGLKECVLLYKILEVREFREIYTGYLRDFASVDNPWTGQAGSAERIKAWQKLFGPYVSNDTGEDMALRDAPASWGNHHEYRLLEDGPNNWFRVKAGSISSWIGQ